MNPTQTLEPVETEVEKKYKVIGTRPIRHDGVDKVTGRAVYGADVQLPGMLHGKVLRSPHAHARIKSINTEKAEALYGVKAVMTAADFPDSGESHRQPGGIGRGPLEAHVRQRDGLRQGGLSRPRRSRGGGDQPAHCRGSSRAD